MQHIIVNSKIQKISGTDTSFTVNFQNSYNGKRLVLNQFITTNFFSNFGIGEQEFSYEVAGGIKYLNISQIHLSLSEFFIYFNQIQSDTVLSYVVQFGRVIINSTNQFAVRGTGWSYKLGFTEQQLGDILKLQLKPLKYYNLTQSPIVYVRFRNIANSFIDGSQNVGFQIQNNSSFGSRLTLDNDNLISNQQILLNQDKPFNQLIIQLEDHNGRLLQTQNNNDTGLDVFMSMTLYQE